MTKNGKKIRQNGDKGDDKEMTKKMIKVRQNGEWTA